MQSLPEPTWKQLIEARELEERRERERQLEEGRKAYHAKLRRELLEANTTTYPPLSEEEITYHIERKLNNEHY